MWLIAPPLAMTKYFPNYPICDSCDILSPGIDILTLNIQNRPSHVFLIMLTALWLIAPPLAMTKYFPNYPICDSCDILSPGIDILTLNIQNRPSHVFLIMLTG